ncbi:MAG: rhodanese-like domain-containing protein [Anaerolineales bacterium]
MNAPVQGISPQELKARLDAGEDIVVIDVRMPYELDITQLDFAEHIVLDELPERMQEVPQDKPVVVVCRSGGRSQQACMFLATRGWEPSNLYNLEGGILRWARDVDPTLPTFY